MHLRRGYLVSSGGVSVGLTAGNTQGDFAYIKLERAGDDWAATPVCIAVNGATPAACGTLLMDTGVTAMYLTVPDSQAPDAILTSTGRSPTLVDGTKLTISIPTEAAPQALYGFTVGGAGNPLAPARLILVSRLRPPFVNTSVHFLNGFDYLYDADGGFVGFRWRWSGNRPRKSAGPPGAKGTMRYVRKKVGWARSTIIFRPKTWTVRAPRRAPQSLSDNGCARVP